MLKLRKWFHKLRHAARYFISSVVVCVGGKRRKANRTMRELKDKYKGQRCFVIGNGPSLTVEDLNLLKGEVTFASNRIYKMFEQTDWRPTYYAVFDEWVGSDPELPKNVNSFHCEGKFVREQGWYVYRRIKDAVYLHSWYGPKYLNAPKFSSDLGKGVYAVATVTYSMFQLARYMGFSEIYLIGVDHKYANELTKDGKIIKNEGVKSYFGKDSKREAAVVGASWEMELIYQYAEDFSRKNGFRIFNATRGGCLEVFERVSLDDVLKGKI